VGSDRQVSEDAATQIDASPSYNPDNSSAPLRFAWSCAADNNVVCDKNLVRASA
jgi:hypothetical protein